MSASGPRMTEDRSTTTVARHRGSPAASRRARRSVRIDFTLDPRGFKLRGGGMQSTDDVVDDTREGTRTGPARVLLVRCLRRGLKPHRSGGDIASRKYGAAVATRVASCPIRFPLGGMCCGSPYHEISIVGVL